MPTGSHVYISPVQRMVWLQVALSSRCRTADYERLRRRLAAFLARSGIAAISTTQRIGLLSTGRDITATDTAVVVDWLIAQPEVVLVRRERPQGGFCTRRSHG
jgi:hypothetical protein